MDKLKCPSTQFIRVLKGQNIKNLCQKYKIPEIVLIADNLLKKEVQEGDIIIINKYNMRLYTVSLFENIEDVCKKFNMTKGEFVSVNRTDYVFHALKVLVKK